MNTTFTRDLSPEYLAALAAHNVALAAFSLARDAFRAGGSDAEFAAAATEMKKADAAFDVAFAAEASLGEPA